MVILTKALVNIAQALVTARAMPEWSCMITAEQIRAARGLLGWTQQDLADHSLLSVNTIRRIEKGSADTLVSSAAQVREALEAAGVEFSMRGDHGVRMRRQVE